MRRNVTIAIVVLVVAAVAGFAATALWGGGDDEGSRRITTAGTATVSTAPDEAVLSVGVRTEAAAGQDAFSRNAAKMDAVLAALRDAGVAKEDLRTTNVSLQRQTRDRGTPRETTTYVASNQVEVTIVDLQKVGTTIDAAVKAGADQVRDIRFQLSDPVAARQQALEEAVQGSRAKADAMAAAAGASVTRVFSIREQTTGNDASSARPLAYDQAFAGALLQTPVVPPEGVETRVTVVVVWDLG